MPTPTNPAPTEEAARDLASLIAAARLAAQHGGDPVAGVVRLLADAGGALPVETLQAQGATDAAIAAAVAVPADKRAKAKARLGIVGGEPALWLTATGHQAAGRPSGREIVPGAATIAHALAPRELAQWVAQRAPTLGQRCRVSVLSGPACKRFSEEVVARAWTRIRSHPDADGSTGALTGGLYADALICERWAASEGETYARAWGVAPDSFGPDDLAETTVGVEIEDTRKAGEPLRHKVSRWEAACELGAARAVVWVPRSAAVARSLLALGVGDPSRQPHQRIVSAAAVGLAGDPLPAGGAGYWLTSVPAAR